MQPGLPRRPHEQAQCDSSGLGAEPHPSHPHPQPQTPHLEEDLKEVLRSEAGIELIIEDEVRPEKQKRKAGVSSWGTHCRWQGWGTGTRGRGAGAAREQAAGWGAAREQAQGSGGQPGNRQWDGGWPGNRQRAGGCWGTGTRGQQGRGGRPFL